MFTLPARDVLHFDWPAGERLDAGLRSISKDGHGQFAVCYVMFVFFWFALFYLLVWIQPALMKKVPPSSKDHENDRYWCARNWFGIVHAFLVAVVSVPALLLMINAPTHVQFAFTDNFADCRLQPGPAHDYNRTSQAIGLAALAVITFLAADLIILFVHRQMTLDYFVHHVAFISAGTLLRVNCMLPFNGVLLLSMEASTPFLNYVLLFRHRGRDCRTSTAIAGAFFFLLFVVFRIGFNTYGTIALWAHRHHATPPWVPEWEAWLVLWSIIAGCLVQYYWLPGILRTMQAAVSEASLPIDAQAAETRTLARDDGKQYGSISRVFKTKALRGKPCTSRWPRIGDRIQRADGEKYTQPGWALCRGEVATVTNVDQDGDFKVRNPQGVESPKWAVRDTWLYCEEVDEAA